MIRKKSLRIVILLSILVVFVTWLNKGEDQTISRSPAEKVVRAFFESLKNNDKLRIDSYVTHGNKGVWSRHETKYVKVLSIKEDDLAKKSYLKYGRGEILKPFDVKAFSIFFLMSCDDPSMDNIWYDWHFTVIKERKDSPWLIDAWGMD